jgi:LacI family transcriptional regulator
VAEAAGVHAATASRALNPETRRLVNAETARRVLRAAESLGFSAQPDRPQPQDRQVRHDRTGPPRHHQPAVPADRAGDRGRARRRRVQRLIVNTDNDPERERAQIASLRSRQVEGLIVATARLDHPLLTQLHDQG